MSAQVTEAHRGLARRIMFEFTQAGTATASDVRDAAQLIADSEARAVIAIAAERDWLKAWQDQAETNYAIGELAIAAQKTTDAYCNESTIGPSEADWSVDGTEEHRLWNAMESDIAALRAAIDAAMKEGAK